MTERIESSNSLALPLLALLSIAATFFTPQEESLASTRPKGGAASREGPGNSRLWHDPFEHRDKLPLGAPTLEPAPAHVLLIAVSAGSQSVDSESRCRTRVALHAAMNSLGYEPCDAATLSCVEADLAVASSVTAIESPAEGVLSKQTTTRTALKNRPGAPAIHLPFEEFRHGCNKTMTAVAFWIPERELQDRLGPQWASTLPRALVAGMLKAATPPQVSAMFGFSLELWTPAAMVRDRDVDDLVGNGGIQFTLIGPATTDSLIHTKLAGLQVRSPWVTGVDVKVKGSADIESLICTDEVLAQTLAAELHERGIGPDSRVLLVLERDSAFARNWQQHLETAMGPSTKSEANAVASKQEEQEAKEATARNKKRFFQAWYSRGLDGEEGNPNQTDTKQPAIEPPAGSNTIDYLRRLRNEFRHDDDASRIDAVGIFGQDIHDKLLILRALRSTFPEAVFFTNDLDAYYGHPSQLPHTRNLLVASGHGLLPDPDANADAKMQTPFRNAYQTSTWLAIRDALGAKAPPLTKGHVFEIGSSGPVRLQAGSGATRMCLLGNAAALFLVLVLGALLHWRLIGGKLVNASANFIVARRSWHWAALAVTALCATTWLAVWLSEEPANWFDGLSIWPSETIRLLALALAMVFAFHACRTLHRVTRWVKADATTVEAAANAPSLLASVRAAANALTCALWRCTDPLRAIVRRWRRQPQAMYPGVRVQSPRGHSPGEIVREKAWSSLFMAIALLAFGKVVMHIFGMPRTPARGSFATTLDWVIVMTCVTASLWLVFLVVELTRQYIALCRTVARELPREPEAVAGGVTPTDNTAAFDRIRAFLTNLAHSGSRGIYGPFIVIMLLCLARWNGFDHWTWPVGLQVVIGISGACVLVAHISLHRAAVALRNRLVRRLTQAIEIDQGANKRLAMIRDDVRALTNGIFAGPTNHPVMRALVIPFTGVGGLSLLQWVQAL